MAAKKVVATPARPTVTAVAEPAKLSPAKVTPATMAAVKVRPAIIAPAKTDPAQTTALTPAAVVERSQASPETASLPEPAVALSSNVETATKTSTDLPVGTTVMLAEIVKLKTEDKYTMENAMKSTEDFVSFGQGNVEAVMKSSQIWATGLQDLSKHFAATAQASIDETMATVKALSSVKSLKEAMDMQSSLAKTAMEKMMAESGKLTDASMKLAEQAIAPLTARVTLAAEKFGRTA